MSSALTVACEVILVACTLAALRLWCNPWVSLSHCSAERVVMQKAWHLPCRYKVETCCKDAVWCCGAHRPTRASILLQCLAPCLALEAPCVLHSSTRVLTRRCTALSLKAVISTVLVAYSKSFCPAALTQLNWNHGSPFHPPVFRPKGYEASHG